MQSAWGAGSGNGPVAGPPAQSSGPGPPAPTLCSGDQDAKALSRTRPCSLALSSGTLCKALAHSVASVNLLELQS